MWAVSALFLLAALLAGCGAAAPGGTPQKLLVTSFSPLEGQGQLRIRFNRPVVGEQQVGRTLERAPAAIIPALRVAGSWTDRQTLVLQPLSRMRPSTRYQVSLSGKLPGLQGQTLFSFVHRPLQVQRLSGVELRRVPPSPSLVLHFNQPVLAGDAARACWLEHVLSGGKVALSTADSTLVAGAVHLQPAVRLAQGQGYTLRCERLTGHGGDAPMSEPYSSRLETYPPLSVTGHGPSGERVPADEVRVTLRFSTPVDLGRVRRALSMAPFTPGIRRGTLDRSSTTYTAVLDLKTTTRYTVRVSKDLQDAFGQRLGRDLRFKFVTSDASPRLVMERGIYALEAASGGYPVWTRNLGHFDVECARVPRQRVVRLLTSSLNYDPWYNGSDDRPLAWRKLGLRRAKKRLRLARVKNKWELTRLQLDRLCDKQSAGGRGLFLAELRSDGVIPDDRYRHRPRQRVLANVTDLGLLLKVGPGSGLVWVTSIQSGRPVPGARVTVYTLRGRRAFSGTTGRQGLLRLPGSTRLLRQPGAHDKNPLEDESWDDYDGHRAQRLIVVAEKGQDLAVVDGNWANGIQIWNFGLPVDRSGGRARVRGFIQSDRGIYRPGEQVHFKGLVRIVESGRSPRLPRKKKIKVQVEDSRGSVILRRRLRLSAFGGFALNLRLGPGAPLGDYWVNASIGKQTFRERFMVEEFRKVSYELKLRGHERHTRLGRKQRLKLDARYLFGAPVQNATVRWHVQRRPHHLRFGKYPGYFFADHAARGRHSWWWDRRGSNLSFVSDGEGQTDARGHFDFAFKDLDRGLSQPHDYLAQVTVTDETDQSVSKRVVITAHPTDLYLGMHAQEFVQAVGMPFSVNTLALTPDGRRVAARATLSLVQGRSVCKDRRGGGYRSHRSCTTRYDRLWTREVRVPATGKGVERIMPTRPGEFILRLQGRDSRGRRVAASTHVWIIGKGQAFWSGDESARLSLVASKARYRPGETARLVPRANMAGASALVTLERGGVLEARVTRLASSGEGIRVPLGQRHAPNVFASVALVRGRTGPGDARRPRFKLGMVELKVSPEGRRLQVVVDTERQSYEPGQTVRGTLRVAGADGKPARAELSLSAADEGVLQLIAYKTPDPMLSFYAAFGLGVDSATNLNRVARLNDPGVLDPDEGGDGGGADSGPRVRSRFVSSAFWAPSLRTDARGEVAFAFKAPDNLTAFRLMAVAADTGDRFGSGEARVTISQPLLAKPVLPRFLRSGDQAEVGVMVHNYTGARGTATVTARASGVRFSGGRARRVRLAADGSARVRFKVQVGETRKATFRFRVRLGRHADALAVELPVSRPLVTERRTLARGEVQGQARVALQWPETGVLPADSRLELALDRTGLSELRSSLRYLVRYPYGCLEQTLSGFIPLVKVKDLASSLELSELRGPRLRSFIRAGVAKVIRHQHDTGHFSLWPGARTYPHLTSYAMFGLNEARRAGVKVDRAALERGARAMRAFANSSARTLGPGGESATVAMTAFVLADLGQPDRGLNARLYAARGALPLYGRAFLLRALKLSGAPDQQLTTLTAELARAARTSGGAALIKETSGGRETFDNVHFYMSSDVRSTAIVLSALMQARPDHKLVPALVAGLKQAQRPDGRWYNTQENIYALVALSDYARQRAAGSARVSVALDGRRLLSQRIRGSKVAALSRSLSGLRPGTLTIRSQGRARYTVRLLLARRASDQDRPRSRGLSVERRYLDPDTDQPVTSLRAGQLVKVRLRVSTKHRRHYVALQDPLPAGLEALNTRLATTSHRRNRAPGARRAYWWRKPVWSYQELRDDRVRAFSDLMRPGAHTLEYLARATISGSFTAAPAQAEAMYEPDVMGRSVAVKLQVTR